MSVQSNISLLDLSKQLPFCIDESMKKQICFGQTMLISCGHYEGTIGEEESESESDWNSTVVEEEKTEECVSKDEDKTIEIFDEPPVEEVEEEEKVEDDRFTFYFFPDCTKPQPELTGKESIIMEDGFPQLNPLPKEPSICSCPRGADGICDCFTKLPCKCGKKKQKECTCKNEQNICICADPDKPALTCTCEDAEICMCFPELFPRTTCKCNELEKVCICECRKGKFPSPICTCPHKPNFDEPMEDNEEGEGEDESDGKEKDKETKRKSATDTSISSVIEAAEGEEPIHQEIITGPTKIPCTCTKKDPKPPCLCGLSKKNKCTCKEPCTCVIQNLCTCEPKPDTKLAPCKSDDKLEICDCFRPPKVCECDVKSTGECECLPEKPVCTCGEPDNCRCFLTCQCDEPCVCDTVEEKLPECVCLKNEDQICRCPPLVISKKLKKVKVKQQGFRWCHEVDPRHTYFDYAYDRHDKIDIKLQEREMFKILGLHDDAEEGEECQIHKDKIPEFKKKVRKESLDCCSTVGGISFNVETLGDLEDKFLIQVVSNASKEGAKTGTKLISIVDCNLHTLEENRIEYITKRDVTKERRSYVTISESGYYNKITRTHKDRTVKKRYYHSFEDAHDLLLEGANIVFLRYVGLTRYRGTVKTETITMKGTVCQSIYVSHGVSQAVVNNTPLYVVKVERHIIEPSGLVHQTLTIVTLRGYLVSHEWADNNYIMHLNPLLKIDPINDTIEEHAALRETWREDLQLLSDYLDFKSKRTAAGARYMHENGELTAFVKDYLQAILMLKPQNVLHFTRHYFGSVLSAIDLPHNEFFQPTGKRVRYYYLEDI